MFGTDAQKTILIVDDHPIFRFGIAQLLSDSTEFKIVAEAGAGPAALEAMRRTTPDLALLDISMPGMNGLELLKIMLAENPALQVLVLSMHEDTIYALRALRAGAKGYIMKLQAMDSLMEALRKICRGGIYVSPEFSDRLIFKAIHSQDSDFGTPVDKLSDRELEVLDCLGRGSSTREIAEQLHLSVKTVETHRAHLKSKLGFRESDELIRFATEWVALKSCERPPA